MIYFDLWGAISIPFFLFSLWVIPFVFIPSIRTILAKHIIIDGVFFLLLFLINSNWKYNFDILQFLQLFHFIIFITTGLNDTKKYWKEDNERKQKLEAHFDEF